MKQKERNLVMHAIRWTIDNYPDIVIVEKYGKEPKLGLLCDEVEKEIEEIYGKDK
jgi:hypothetical protein